MTIGDRLAATTRAEAQRNIFSRYRCGHFAEPLLLPGLLPNYSGKAKAKSDSLRQRRQKNQTNQGYLVRVGTAQGSYLAGLGGAVRKGALRCACTGLRNGASPLRHCPYLCRADPAVIVL
jgi:hypothetical protein